MAEGQLRTLIDDELKTFNTKLGDSVENLNSEFLKQNSNSLLHRAEGN